MLSECTCRAVMTQDEIAAECDVIHCRRPGCETKWVSLVSPKDEYILTDDFSNHLLCIGLEYMTSNWTCDACGSDH
jgi:hypothetical protein